MNEPLLSVVVTSREAQGKDVVVLELSRRDSGSLPAFEAGAHIDVHVDPEIVRQYSLSNRPGVHGAYRIGVLKEPESRGGSVKVHDEFVVGTQLQISAPRNLFALSSDAVHSVLIGGGIGITPIIAMGYELQARNQSCELHYCMRTAGAGAFADELAKQFPGIVHFHYDDAGDQQRLNPQQLLSSRSQGTHMYVCGPSGFMDWVIDSAKQAGYAADKIHFEYFHADVDTSGSAFEVHCAQSDITVEVGPEQTIVKALAQAGIKVDVSCEQGVCGTCIADVLEGEPDHRDQFLLDDEKKANDQMTLCCSRAKSERLVIDL